MKQLKSIGSDGWGSHLSRIMNLSDVGLAGQSDGANASQPSAMRPVSERCTDLPVAPKAVAVLSGTAWSYLPNGKIGSYGGSATSPPLLQVQSDADGCVSPSEAADLFAGLQDGLSAKWFVTLLGADHLGPYEGVAPVGSGGRERHDEVLRARARLALVVDLGGGRCEGGNCERGGSDHVDRG